MRNAHFEVREWGHDVVFLRRLATGGASRSYGIQVARLAGLPDAVIARARQLLATLEAGDLAARGRARARRSSRSSRRAARPQRRRPCRRWSRACSTSCGASTSIASRRSTRSRCCTGSRRRCARATLVRSRLVATALLAFAAVRVARRDASRRVSATCVDVEHWSYPELQPRRDPDVGADRSRRSARRPADPGGDKPARLYFDVPGMWAGKRFAEPIRVGDGLLRQVRVGQNTLETTRVVLDLERYGRHRVMQLAAPARIVIDVFAPQAAEGDAQRAGDADGSAEPTIRAAALRTRLRALPMELRPVRTVVVDAGHGGRDPGAIGVGGLREKDVTLALAQDAAEEPARARLRRRADARSRPHAVARGAHGDRRGRRRRRLRLGARQRVAARRSRGRRALHAAAERRAPDAAPRRARERRRAARRSIRSSACSRGCGSSEAGARSSLLARQVHHEIASGMGSRWPSVREPGAQAGTLLRALSLRHARAARRGGLRHASATTRERLRDPRYLRAMAEEIAQGVERFRDQAAPVVAERRP